MHPNFAIFCYFIFLTVGELHIEGAVGSVRNFLLSSAVKEFLKSPNIRQSYEQMFVGMFFDSQCIVLANK